MSAGDESVLNIYPTDHPCVDKDTCKINLLVFLFLRALLTDIPQKREDSDSRGGRTVPERAPQTVSSPPPRFAVATPRVEKKSCLSYLYSFLRERAGMR